MLAGGKYVNLSFDSRPSKDGEYDHLRDLHEQKRPKYSGKLKQVVDIFHDKTKYSLLLLGNPGTGTGWHRDWAEARNFAFAFVENSFKHANEDTIVRNGSDCCLALWVFVIVGKEAVVQDWLVAYSYMQIQYR